MHAKVWPCFLSRNISIRVEICKKARLSVLFIFSCLIFAPTKQAGHSTRENKRRGEIKEEKKRQLFLPAI